MGAATRTITFTVLDSNNVQTISTSVVQLRPTPQLSCPTQIVTPDVVFVIDVSTLSSSAAFVALTTSYLQGVVAGLPVSSNMIRYVTLCLCEAHIFQCCCGDNRCDAAHCIRLQ